MPYRLQWGIYEFGAATEAEMLQGLKGLFRSRRPTLVPGGQLSELSGRTCEADFIPLKVQAAENQQQRFHFAILLLCLWCAEEMVRSIERLDPVLRFFNGTARDVLLYEAFVGNYLMLLHQGKRELSSEWWAWLNVYGKGALAFATSFANNVIEENEADQHMNQRREFIESGQSVGEMAERLASVLLASQGKQRIGNGSTSTNETVEGLQATVGLPLAVVALTAKNIPAASQTLLNLFAGTFRRGA